MPRGTDGGDRVARPGRPVQPQHALPRPARSHAYHRPRPQQPGAPRPAHQHNNIFLLLYYLFFRSRSCSGRSSRTPRPGFADPAPAAAAWQYAAVNMCRKRAKMRRQSLLLTCGRCCGRGGQCGGRGRPRCRCSPRARRRGGTPAPPRPRPGRSCADPSLRHVSVTSHDIMTSFVTFRA